MLENRVQKTIYKCTLLLSLRWQLYLRIYNLSIYTFSIVFWHPYSYTWNNKPTLVLNWELCKTEMEYWPLFLEYQTETLSFIKLLVNYNWYEILTASHDILNPYLRYFDPSTYDILTPYPWNSKSLRVLNCESSIMDYDTSLVCIA